jgi:hypothetical protein
MTIYEKTFIAMVRTCLTYLQKNETQWRSIPVLVDLYNRLVELEANIASYEQLQETVSTKAEIAQRKQDAEGLAKNYYRLSRRLLLYAQNTNNMLLAKQTDISEAKFKAKNANKLMITCTTLLGLARDNLKLTGDYKITEGELNDLEAYLLDFKSRPVEVLHQGNESRRATRELKTTLIEVRKVLQKLDFGMDGMITDENFIGGWNDVRRIKSRPIPKKKDKIDSIKDENNE